MAIMAEGFSTWSAMEFSQDTADKEIRLFFFFYYFLSSNLYWALIFGQGNRTIIPVLKV